MKKVKIVVFVPNTHTEKLLKSIGEAGGGIIGNYSFCSFVCSGTGRFKPNEKANPFIGKSEKINEVCEDRVEFVCARGKAKAIISKIKQVHPYEETALDIYPLIDEREL